MKTFSLSLRLGRRQGCPHSSLLFSIALEILAIETEKKKDHIGVGAVAQW